MKGTYEARQRAMYARRAKARKEKVRTPACFLLEWETDGPRSSDKWSEQLWRSEGLGRVYYTIERQIVQAGRYRVKHYTFNPRFDCGEFGGDFQPQESLELAQSQCQTHHNIMCGVRDGTR